MSPIRDSCSRSKREVAPAKWRHCRSATTRWALDRCYGAKYAAAWLVSQACESRRTTIVSARQHEVAEHSTIESLTRISTPQAIIVLNSVKRPAGIDHHWGWQILCRRGF